MADIQITVPPPTAVIVTNSITSLNVVQAAASTIVVNIVDNKYKITTGADGGNLTITAV